MWGGVDAGVRRVKRRVPLPSGGGGGVPGACGEWQGYWMGRAP